MKNRYFGVERPYTVDLFLINANLNKHANH